MFEYFMIFVAFLIGAISLYHGYKKHHHEKWPLIVFSAGIMLLVIKQLWHERQIIFLVLAVILIISAHILNHRRCRVHNHAHKEDCDH